MNGDLQFSVLRADDLLVLTFDCFNLRLDTPAGQPPRLSRVTAGQPAFVVVGLPPQHVAEQFMISNTLFGPSTAMANPSRLAFQVADDLDAIPFTLEALLNWAGYSPSVTANAVAQLPGPARPAPAEPAPTQTAIELPYRLVLSPDASAGWAHALGAVVHDRVAELWHTRLGVRQDGGVDETRMPTLRAVWARDSGEVGFDTVGSPLDADKRIAITYLSSDFTQTVMRFGPGAPPGGQEDPYDPPPLHATHLMLSALGGWTDIRGEWDFPDDQNQVWPTTPFVSWRNVVAQGRDQYVRVVQKGFLYPLGHRAVWQQVIERKLVRDSATEFLVETVMQVAVREPVRDYTQLAPGRAHDAQLPLRRARMETMVTPHLADPTGPAFVPTLQVGEPFRFHVVGEDWEGRRVDLHMPLVFVPADNPGGGGELYDDWLRTVDLGGQQVALAPHPPSPGATALPVQTFAFTHVDTPGLSPPFLPYVQTAAVRIPAIDHLVGAHAPAPPALVELVDPERTPGQVFARLPPGSPMDLNLPADRAGGLARPNLSIQGVSSSLGAVPGGLDDLAAGRFDPATLFSQTLGDATLLGAIKLRDVIGDIVDTTHLPTLSHADGPGGVDVAFEWTPPLRQETGPLKLNQGGTSTLSLRTTMHMPVGPGAQPGSTVEGLLTNFALDFADVVRVSVDSLRFHAGLGRKLDVNPRGVRLELRNELSFLNALADILPADGFSDPPALRVTPDGVDAEYSLGLPSAGVGIFSLEHVALSAGIMLPFVDRPAAVRLAFSERAHPFLVTVAMIGGAGFFALEVDTAGIRRIEGSIEVGANLTIDLAVVSANVHVMAGFYFGLSKGPDGRDVIDFSAYLRIGGAVELLGIAGISIEIYLSMTYESTPQPRIGGRAAVAVAVHLLMFTKSVTLSTERWFDVPALDPSFEDLVDADDWETYCRAFA
jgi:hypothetical protein